MSVNELLSNIDTPAEIKISCDYELKGFCLYNLGCDFLEILTQKEAKEINNE